MIRPEHIRLAERGAFREIPPIKHFNDVVQLDENDFMRRKDCIACNPCVAVQP